MKYIVRPQAHATSPVLLAHDIGSKSRVNGVNGFKGNFSSDLFLWYPEPSEVTGGNSEQYQLLYKFFSKNKGQQRILLADLGIPVPKTYLEPVNGSNKFVKRPLRHQGSQDYTIVTGGLPSFTPGQEYLSEFFPKEREYRLIYVKGKLAIAIRKKPKEGITADMPWGNTNATWQKITASGSLLEQAGCLQKLAECPVLKYAHLVAVDVLYSSQTTPKYTVLEFNTCPDLQVDGYRQAVATAIQNAG